MKEANNISGIQIHLYGSFGETGFGFSCMRQAFELNIYGQLQYVTPHIISISAMGNETALMKFYHWCISCTETKNGEIEAKSDIIVPHKDFKIINSI
jgi:acylphosphatase